MLTIVIGTLTSFFTSCDWVKRATQEKAPLGWFAGSASMKSCGVHLASLLLSRKNNSGKEGNESKLEDVMPSPGNHPRNLLKLQHFGTTSMEEFWEQRAP